MITENGAHLMTTDLTPEKRTFLLKESLYAMEGTDTRIRSIDESKWWLVHLQLVPLAVKMQDIPLQFSAQGV
jgi:hypothetical protein